MAAMFAARPPAGPPLPGDLHLVRATRRGFSGTAGFLADPANQARVGEYLADMARPYHRELRTGDLGASAGQSYGEMAAVLIGQVASADEPVDLLVLAFSIHDLWPGRPTAAYLSHVTPGAPMAFAICDQGSAAAFSGLRVIREYASSAAVGRALLIVVEQAVLPYGSPVAPPKRHQGVAMLYSRELPGPALGRVRTLYQHPDVPPAAVADLAAADLAALTASHHEMAVVLGAALAELWTAPTAKRIRAMPPGQPSTAVWWGLIDELASADDHPDLVVVADYDPGLRYLCLAAFTVG
jgi:hypothetical protein